MVQVHLCRYPLYERIIRLFFFYLLHRNFTELFKTVVHLIHYETGNLWRKYAEIIGDDDKKNTQ